MAYYIDLKYLKMISFQLEGFSQKKEDVFNCKCPICGDSKKNKSKKRGFFFRKNSDMLYKCFNCDVGMSFYNFLNFIDSNIAKEYSLEKYKEKNNTLFSEKTKPLPKVSIKEKSDINLPCIKDLSDDHFAKKYIIERKIPKGCHKDLYFAEDYKSFISELKPSYEQDLPENDPRIVIPFRDEYKKIFAVQGRSLKSKIRYITIKINETTKIFGLDRIKKNEFIYVVEGPIDSMFINNAVATADSNLTIAEFLGKDKIILVYDNEPRNPMIIKQMEKAIEKDFKIVIFPEFVKPKDINEMILNGYSRPEIKRLLENNNYSGLRARIEFNKWRKC